MDKLLTVSASPHNYGKETINSLMRGVIIALIPVFAVALYLFGIGVLIVTLTSVASAMLFEYLISKFILKKEPTLTDGSAIVTGLLLAANVPSNLPVGIVIIGSFVAIGVGKMTFGGLGNNPFNPALVGRVFLLVSFPVNMTKWPTPIVSRLQYFDAVTGATPLATLKEGLKNGQTIPQMMSELPTHAQTFLGQTRGSLGEVAALAIILGFAYMLYKKIITWHIPVSIVGTIAVITGIRWGINPDIHADPMFHIFSGGVLLGAVFMATDYVTSPMSAKGQIVFGIGIGVLTVVIRIAGAYPEGISFAILIMNAFVPLINMYFKPKRFGEVMKNGK